MVKAHTKFQSTAGWRRDIPGKWNWGVFTASCWLISIRKLKFGRRSNRSKLWKIIFPVELWRGGHKIWMAANPKVVFEWFYRSDLLTMPYHDLGTPSQSAVTHHNILCLVPDLDSAQLPVSDLLRLTTSPLGGDCLWFVVVLLLWQTYGRVWKGESPPKDWEQRTHF